MRKSYRALWQFTIPGRAFFSLTGKWRGDMTDDDWQDERNHRSPKHGSWSSNWLDVKRKRTVLRMAGRSPTGYATILRWKRVRGEWRMAQYNYSASHVDSAQHPEQLWEVQRKIREHKPLTPRERMKRRK